MIAGTYVNSKRYKALMAERSLYRRALKRLQKEHIVTSLGGSSWIADEPAVITIVQAALVGGMALQRKGRVR